MNRLLRPLARQEGFTLAELLIVVAVVGILLAVAVPTYLGFTKKANDTAGAANARSASVTQAAEQALESAAPASSPASSGTTDATDPGSTGTTTRPDPDATPVTQPGTVTTPGRVTTQPGRGRVRVQRPATLPTRRPRLSSETLAATRTRS